MCPSGALRFCDYFLVIRHCLMLFLYIFIRAIGLELGLVLLSFYLKYTVITIHLTCRQRAKRLAKLNCSYWDALLYVCVNLLCV